MTGRAGGRTAVCWTSGPLAGTRATVGRVAVSGHSWIGRRCTAGCILEGTGSVNREGKLPGTRRRVKKQRSGEPVTRVAAIASAAEEGIRPHSRQTWSRLGTP